MGQFISLPLFLSLLSFFSRYFPPSLSLLPSPSLSLSGEEGVQAVFTSQRERERGKCGHTLSIPHSFSISHRNLIISMACVIIILTTKLKGAKAPIIPFKNIISWSLFLSLSPSSPIIEREREGRRARVACTHSYLLVACASVGVLMDKFNFCLYPKIFFNIGGKYYVILFASKHVLIFFLEYCAGLS